MTFIPRSIYRPRPPVKTDECQHNWQKYKETVQVENLKSPIYEAYFILKACIKCKAKQYIEYIAKREGL